MYETSSDGIDAVRRGLFLGWWLNVSEVIDGEREDSNHDDACTWADLPELPESNASLGAEQTFPPGFSYVKKKLYQFLCIVIKHMNNTSIIEWKNIDRVKKHQDTEESFLFIVFFYKYLHVLKLKHF